MSEFKNIEDIEKRLWAAADQLRASDDYVPDLEAQLISQLEDKVDALRRQAQELDASRRRRRSRWPRMRRGRRNSSRPPPRGTEPPGGGNVRRTIVAAPWAGYPFAVQGRVPKWTKGTDCKSVIRGFESRRRLSVGPSRLPPRHQLP